MEVIGVQVASTESGTAQSVGPTPQLPAPCLGLTPSYKANVKQVPHMEEICPNPPYFINTN